MSRNKLIVIACEKTLSEFLGEWPEGFFSFERFDSSDLAELDSSFTQWLGDLTEHRKNRDRSPFEP